MSLADGIAEALDVFKWGERSYDEADDPEEARATQEAHEEATSELLDVMMWKDGPRCPCCGLDR